MRIDAHQHFWNFDSVRDSWITDEMGVLRKDYLPIELQSYLGEHNIEGTVAVQADQSVTETEFLIQLAAKNSFIKGIVGWVDLRARDLAHQLDALAMQEKLVGFRH